MIRPSLVLMPLTLLAWLVSSSPSVGSDQLTYEEAAFATTHELQVLVLALVLPDGCVPQPEALADVAQAELRRRGFQIRGNSPTKLIVEALRIGHAENRCFVSVETYVKRQSIGLMPYAEEHKEFGYVYGKQQYHFIEPKKDMHDSIRQAVAGSTTQIALSVFRARAKMSELEPEMAVRFRSETQAHNADNIFELVRQLTNHERNVRANDFGPVLKIGSRLP